MAKTASLVISLSSRPNHKMNVDTPRGGSMQALKQRGRIVWRYSGLPPAGCNHSCVKCKMVGKRAAAATGSETLRHSWLLLKMRLCSNKAAAGVSMSVALCTNRLCCSHCCDQAYWRVDWLTHSLTECRLRQKNKWRNRFALTIPNAGAAHCLFVPAASHYSQNADGEVVKNKVHLPNQSPNYWATSAVYFQK